jgi:hypothetical protein
MTHAGIVFDAAMKRRDWKKHFQMRRKKKTKGAFGKPKWTRNEKS